MKVVIRDNAHLESVVQTLTNRHYFKDEVQSTNQVMVYGKTISGCKKMSSCLKKIAIIVASLGFILISKKFFTSTMQTFEGRLVKQLDISNLPILPLINIVPIDNPKVEIFKETVSPSDMIHLQAILKKEGQIEAYIEDIRFTANQGTVEGSLNIDDAQGNKIEIIFDVDGNFISVADDSECYTDIPELWIPFVKILIKKAYELSAEYKPFTPARVELQGLHPVQVDAQPIYITLAHAGLKANPEYHLRKFVEMVTAALPYTDDPKIAIRFLKDDLSAGKGQDDGGLARDYFEYLLKGLIAENSEIFRLDAEGNYLPYNLNENTPWKLDEEKKSLYKNLGFLLMYCYHSKNPNEGNALLLANLMCFTGRYFSDALIKVLLSFDDTELNQSAEYHSKATQIKLCLAFLEARKASNTELAEHGYIAQYLFHDNIDGLVVCADEIENLPADFKDTDGSCNVTDSSGNKEAFCNFMLNHMLTLPFDGKCSLKAMMAPAQAIARGMKDFRVSNIRENVILPPSHQYEAVSDKIQGSMNREDIIQRIVLDRTLSGSTKNEIAKKADWLKSWLKNEATDEEFKGFLRYVTGASGLPAGVKITIEASNDTSFPIPRVSTCTMTLKFSTVPCGDSRCNDRTKEAFIDVIKNWCLVKTDFDLA